jgi:hypothetical protein
MKFNWCSFTIQNQIINAGLEIMNNPFNTDDESDYLVHLSKKEDSHGGLMSMLYSGTITAFKPYGYYARNNAEKKVVCFSEIPPPHLAKLIKRRSNHGIAFKKEFLLKIGAQRVWYLEKNSMVHQSLDTLRGLLNNSLQQEALLNLTPFIDVHGEHKGTPYRFEWEREWRVIGDVYFEPNDVAFLIIPSSHHQAARDFFTEAEINQEGPNYPCPYYDPLTDMYTK